jgi:hypothetical protein
MLFIMSKLQLTCFQTILKYTRSSFKTVLHSAATEQFHYPNMKDHYIRPSPDGNLFLYVLYVKCVVICRVGLRFDRTRNFFARGLLKNTYRYNAAVSGQTGYLTVHVLHIIVNVSFLFASVLRSGKTNGWLLLWFVILTDSGFGDLDVACWPLVPKFASSNPTETVGFLGRTNPQHAFLRRGGKAVCPMSCFTACKRTQKWRGSRHFR